MMRKLLVKMLSCMLLVGVLVCGNGIDANAASKEVKAYSKYLAKNKKDSSFKHFAIVDVNKDGVYELIGSNKMNKKTERWISLVLYKNDDVCPYYSVPTQDVLYSHKKQKGLRYVYDGVITYETLSNDGWSSVKILSKQKVNGKTQYYYYTGDLSGESGTSKKISKEKYKKYLKKSWAFNAKSVGVKKVKFYKNTAANRKKLQKGKIK